MLHLKRFFSLNRSPQAFSTTGSQALTELVMAKVSLRALMDGEKKYSPPRGMMKSGNVISVEGLLGSNPDIDLGWPGDCPIRGSSLLGDMLVSLLTLLSVLSYPGFSGVVSLNWKLRLFAHSASPISSCHAKTSVHNSRFWMNWKPLVMLLW
jgi:hypothetical protein